MHLHVISDDRISPCLKTKKHYNSFRPDLGFLVSLEEVERWLEEDKEFSKAQAAVSRLISDGRAADGKIKQYRPSRASIPYSTSHCSAPSAARPSLRCQS